jgi:hypothetical protein
MKAGNSLPSIKKSRMEREMCGRSEFAVGASAAGILS